MFHILIQCDNYKRCCPGARHVSYNVYFFSKLILLNARYFLTDRVIKDSGLITITECYMILYNYWRCIGDRHVHLFSRGRFSRTLSVLSSKVSFHHFLLNSLLQEMRLTCRKAMKLINGKNEIIHCDNYYEEYSKHLFKRVFFI